MAGVIATIPKYQFSSQLGFPLAYGTLETYVAGSSTPTPTWQDEALTTANTNPITLDARGECVLWLDPLKKYKFILKNSLGAVQWTQDNISGAGAGALTTVNTLQIDLSAPGGSDLVGFAAPSAGSVARTVGAKLRETVSILDYGGLDDDSTDNALPFTRAAAAVGPGGVIYFPKTTLGIYKFVSDPNLSQALLDVDESVTLKGPFAAFSTQKVRRDTKLRVTSQNFNYGYTAENLKPYVEKSLFLSDGDIDFSTVDPIIASSQLVNEKIAFPGGDTWADATADQTSTGDTVSWNSLPADGNIRMSWMGVRPGDELAVSFNNIVAYKRVAAVRTTRGYYFVMGDVGADPISGGKIVGAGVVQSAFGYSGRTLSSYDPSNCHWSIRIYDRTHFSVLLNGVEVSGIIATFGEIYRAGFGVLPTSAGGIYPVVGWYRTRNKPQAGKKDISVLTAGDSLTAPIQGGWAQFMREAIDGSMGLRLNKLDNIAVSGSNSGDALNALATHGTGGATHAFLCVGTNDVQGGSPSSNTVINLGTMIDYCIANACTPIVWIFPHWYRPADVGGDGQATTNFQLGAPYRIAIGRLAASKGVKCIDLTQVLGPVLPGYYSNEAANGIGSMLRDNLHQSNYGNKIIGFAMARALAGAVTRPFDRSLPESVFPATVYSNGWGEGSESPVYSMGASGLVTLGGLIAGGTLTNGTLVLKLPEHVRPLRTHRCLCATNAATPSLLNITSDGSVTIYNATGVTYVALDGITFQTAG